MKKFKLLVLGSDHVYGHQIAAGQSFVEQLVRRLSHEGRSLTVECHAPMSLLAMTRLLPRLPIQQYDLIVLQPGHHELERPAVLSTLFAAESNANLTESQPIASMRCRQHTSPLRHSLSDACALAGLRLLAGLARLPRLRQTRHQLRAVLEGLQSCGHNVVLVTPFPHQDPISGWLRRKGQQLFLEEGHRAFMPVFDAHSLLDVGDVCFLPNNPATLNALGHELVGSALYDFSRAGVMAVGDSSNF
ncbi:MAG: hypothetical protein H7Z72_25770 [Bacteroidetes bacterium]|nr:hypothetical protein [Fibrella sp.]